MSTTLRRQPSSSPSTPTRSSTPARSSTASTTLSLTVDTGKPCASNTDCNRDWVCSSQRCIPSTEDNRTGGAPLSAPNVPVAASATPSGSEPSDNTLGTGAAIGIGVGIGALFIMIMAFGYCAWRIAKRRREVREIARIHLARATSHDDRWAIDNDQRTLVNSAPNSPQQEMAISSDRGYTCSESPPDMPSSSRLEQLVRSVSQRGGRNGRSLMKRRLNEKEKRLQERDEEPVVNIDKALPAAPPTAPRETVSVHPPSLNVNINKSMIFDEEMLRAAAQVVPRDPPARETPTRERLEGYHFQEYVPHYKGHTNAPRNPLIRHVDTSERRDERYNSQYGVFSVASSDTQSAKGSAYASQRSRASSVSQRDSDTLGQNNSRRDRRYSQEPPVPALPPQIAELPQIHNRRRSYEWYSDLIDAPPSPITHTFPQQEPRDSPAPEPLKPTVYCPPPQKPPTTPLPDPPTTQNSRPLLHPDSAMLSPLSPTFSGLPLSSTLHSNSSHAAFSNRISHLSARSYQSRQSRQSRSWLPEDGVVLPNDGSEEAYELFRRSRYTPSPVSDISRRGSRF